MNGNGHGRRFRIRRNHFWACAIEKITGRPVVLGPYDTEQEANQFGFERIKDGDFTVYEFDTRDKFAARDKFKYKRLEQSGQLSEVFKRAKYRV